MSGPEGLDPENAWDFVGKVVKKYCLIDEISGGLICNKCGSPVTIDFFEQLVECMGCDEI